jgi:ribosomal protein S6--L-glutamate ligase
MGVIVANDADGIARSHDKLRCLQLLAEREIGLPATGVAHSSKDLDCLIASVGGPPLVIKLLEGVPSAGTILVNTRQAAESVIEAFQELNAKSLVQSFVKEASGTSLRCFVVGGRVIAAMRRLAPQGEFRSNLHRGGKAEVVKLTMHERHIAVEATAAMGLKVAGVDMLRSDHGPLVMAVNSTPELEAIEAATGVDVAGKIYKFLEDSASPRDLLEHVEA